VLARRDVPDVEALHAALVERFELLEAVDRLRDELAVDREAHGVETHRVARGELDEDRDLGPGGEQELLLEPRQLLRDVEDVGLDLLYLLVEPLHLLLIARLRQRERGTQTQQARRDHPSAHGSLLRRRRVQRSCHGGWRGYQGGAVTISCSLDREKCLWTRPRGPR
jgi:hypothetical protein